MHAAVPDPLHRPLGGLFGAGGGDHVPTLQGDAQRAGGAANGRLVPDQDTAIHDPVIPCRLDQPQIVLPIAAGDDHSLGLHLPGDQHQIGHPLQGRGSRRTGIHVLAHDGVSPQSGGGKIRARVSATGLCSEQDCASCCEN
jgi:hypothetical protein